jgi:hypothetical protein
MPAEALNLLRDTRDQGGKADPATQLRGRETSMKKFVAVALAAATITGALAISANDAEARRWHRVGFGFGIGFVGPAFHPAWEEDVYHVRHCVLVERYNRRGRYIGVQRVCSVTPY